MQSSGSKFGAAFTFASTYSNANGWDGIHLYQFDVRAVMIDGGFTGGRKPGYGSPDGHLEGFKDYP